MSSSSVDLRRIRRDWRLTRRPPAPHLIKLTSDEEQAAKLIPKRKARPADSGDGGFGGGGRGGARGEQASILAGQAASEARAFVDGKRSVLDIRAAVNAEFGTQGDAAKYVEFFKALEKLGEFELQAKP